MKFGEKHMKFAEKQKLDHSYLEVHVEMLPW